MTVQLPFRPALGRIGAAGVVALYPIQQSGRKTCRSPGRHAAHLVNASSRRYRYPNTSCNGISKGCSSSLPSPQIHVAAQCSVHPFWCSPSQATLTCLPTLGACQRCSKWNEPTARTRSCLPSFAGPKDCQIRFGRATFHQIDGRAPLAVASLSPEPVSRSPDVHRLRR